MDFFAAKAAESSKSSDDVDGFAKAIAHRFKTNPVITANLNAPPPRLLSTTSAPLPPDRFKSVLAKDIQPFLNDPNVLFIDIRPHAAYVSARLPNALSLSVPSTLLKRPLFPLDRLAAMLPSPSARARFNKWRQTSTLIVYDVDSAGSPSGHLPEGNNILGLLRKFANDPQGSYQGQLRWLKGGFQTVWKERRDLVDTRPLDSELDEDEPSSMLQPKHLPMSAFGAVSTTVNKPAQSPLRSTSSRPLLQAPSSMAFNPFFDTIRQNVELSQGITERIPLRIPKHVRRRIKDLPFAWLQEIGRRAEVKPDDESTDESDRSSKSASPDSNRVSTVSFPSQSTSSLSTSSDSTGTPPDPAMVDEGMEALAMQFYRIELAEQRRLMGVMQHHSKESEKGSGPAPSSSSSIQTGEHASSSSPDNMRDISNTSQTSVPFPYSITAGIEKGAKNRYRHIWPFEHARVRLHQEPPLSESESGDFINSNFIPPHHLHAHFTPRSSSSLAPSASNLLSGSTSNPAETSTSSQLSSTSSTSMRPPSGPISGPGRPFALSLPPGSSPFLRPATPATGTGLAERRSSASSASTSRSGLGGSPTKSPRPNARGLKIDLGLGGNSFTSGAQTFGGSALGGGNVGVGRGKFGGGHPGSLPSFTQMRGSHASGGSGGGSGGESAIESSATESEKEHDGEIDGDESTGTGMRREHDDYVNASYVQPLCTTRRYIATQGPLEATFTDFWTIVYQQNVHVIVMLTKEIENSMVKCGPYWKDEVYGPLRLELVGVEGADDAGKSDNRKEDIGGEHSQQTFGGNRGKAHPGLKDENTFSFFPSVKTEDDEVKEERRKRREQKKAERRAQRQKQKELEKAGIVEEKMVVDEKAHGKEKKKKKDKSHSRPRVDRSSSIIKRTFLLSHTHYPHVPPRKVVQFQYLGWPDMNVPEDPRGLLQLIKDVDQAVEEAEYLPGEEFEEEFQARNTEPRAKAEELDRSTGIAKHTMGKEHAPLLLHCSAGVGRTGGFIVVDAVLSSVRRELKKKQKAERDAEKLLLETQREIREDKERLAKMDKMDVEMGAMKDTKKKDDAMEVDSTLAEADIEMTSDSRSRSSPSSGLDVSPRGSPDQQEPGGKSSPPGETIAIYHGGNVLHIPAYKAKEGAKLQSPPDDSGSRSSSHPPKPKSPEADVTRNPQMMDIDQRVQEMYTRPATTRMWAENVSDQTGRHGSAYRVDQARSAFQSQSRLSERDIPRVVTVENKGEDKMAMDTEPTPETRKEKVPPSSVISSAQHMPPSESGSASTSGDSYGFQSAFDKGKGRRHKTSQSLSHIHGHTNLSSFGTSVSSLPLGTTFKRDSVEAADPPVAPRPLPAASAQVERTRTNSAPTAPRPVPANGSRLRPEASWLPDDESRKVASPRAGSEVSSGSPSGGSASGVSGSSDKKEKLKEVKNKLLIEGSTTSLGSHQVGSGSGGSVPPMSGSGTGSGSVSRSRSGSISLSLSGPRSLDIVPEKVSGMIRDAGDSNSDKSKRNSRKSSPAVTGVDPLSGPTTQFDFAAPRELHMDASPKALTSFAEPLLEIVQDMRQQRMSLCQSLRQYVFVHAAILEGALMIMDSEDEKEGTESVEGDLEQENVDFKTPKFERKNLNLTPQNPHLYRSPSAMDVQSTVSAVDTPMKNAVPTVTTGKRLASPTELPEEDKRGQQLLHKKPSIKRKANSSSSNEETELKVAAPASPVKSSTLHPPPHARA